MKCPHCMTAELTTEQVENVAIDRCPVCHGLWLDALELEQLLEIKPQELIGRDQAYQPAAEQGAKRLCPRCGGAHLIKLNSLHRPGTILDSCTVCYGTWLDAGEFARLAGPNLRARIRSLFGR